MVQAIRQLISCDYLLSFILTYQTAFHLAYSQERFYKNVEDMAA